MMSCIKSAMKSYWRCRESNEPRETTLLNLEFNAVVFPVNRSGGVGSVASNNYEPFLQHLVDCLTLVDTQNNLASKENYFLSTYADSAVEKLIPANVRSEFGIFFTTDQISERLTEIFKKEISMGKSFFDPSCGAGNLLVCVASNFPTEVNFTKTIHSWGQKFGGCDLNESFVMAAKLRLIAIAAHRHGVERVTRGELSDLLNHFKNFYVKDYLSNILGSEFDCIIANPPFGHIESPKNTSWCSGKTQLAGFFLTEICERAKPGQKIATVLPDVLRSGTRYSRLRTEIEHSLKNSNILSHGKFSKNVDVDVFILTGEKKDNCQSAESNKIEWIPKKPSYLKSRTIEELFVVRVGPVVRHRIKKTGRLEPFLDVHSAPAYGIASSFENVRFDGTLYAPPFVVIRRTSNPSDKKRLITTLVIGENPVAVENHLIIISPKNQKLEFCHKLINSLNSSEVNERLNQIIRCRHLTTKSIASIELRASDYD